MRKIIDETIGWFSIFLILIAYFLISFDYLSSENLIYHFCNLIGSIGIVYISFKKKVYQPGFLNIIWGLIALISILNTFV
jgi:hypothetical protein